MTKDRANNSYRLGLDVGSNSLGWWIVWTEHDAKEDRYRPIGLGPGGVRIYPDGRDPQSAVSNATARRDARSARRRRDRYLARRRALLEALVRHRLMPAETKERRALERLDPYDLRARALNEPLHPHELGRALFHINQRRGFKSNRKSDRADNEKGAIKQAAEALSMRMENRGAPTLGAYFARDHACRKTVRARPQAGSGGKVSYDFYPTRAMLEAEFDAIWAAQAGFNSGLTEAMREDLRHIVFYQRPLRNLPAGKCVLDPAKSAADKAGFRAPRAHPLVQRFRIWQEVRNLEVRPAGEPPRPLSKEEGDKVALALLQKKQLTFDRIRVLLGLGEDQRFNLESDARKFLKGDELADVLASKNRFGKAWRGFSLDLQCRIAERLEEEQNEAVLIDWLLAETGIDAETAEAVADAPLPEGHGRLGLRAIEAMLPHMEAGLHYHEAAAKAGYDHASCRRGSSGTACPTTANGCRTSCSAAAIHATWTRSAGAASPILRYTSGSIRSAAWSMPLSRSTAARRRSWSSWRGK